CGTGADQPLAPERGFTMTIPEFEVPAGTETQDCYFFAVPDVNHGADVWIDHFQIRLAPGSHHTNVFRLNTVVNLDAEPGGVVGGGEWWKSSNWADWPLVVNSQESQANSSLDWTLPAGVAQRFHAGEKLMVQTHYVNATTQRTPGKGAVRVDFYKSATA